MTRRLQRTLRVIGLAGLGLFAVLQLVPYGRDHTNPAVVREPAWDRPATRALAVRACFDCHSNETRWPWYSHIAPVSWLVQRDVDIGRRALAVLPPRTAPITARRIVRIRTTRPAA